jgi:hypothetical protein
MISLPVAVHNDHFRWQLDLFWFNHKLVYGERAAAKTLALIVERNRRDQPRVEALQWDIDIPHVMCDAFMDHLEIEEESSLMVPLNIQTALAQALPRLHDEAVIEVLDCDMFHLGRYPEYRVRDDEIIVTDHYEPWHLKSLGTHREVISCYFENGGRFYNGGFVPIIGKVRTFKKLLSEWIAVHRHILTRKIDPKIQWWAGMYALQAACEKNKVRMLAEDCCYFPGINQLMPEHYICHYSVDKRFDKKAWPNVDVSLFGDNLFYTRVRDWLASYPHRAHRALKN